MPKYSDFAAVIFDMDDTLISNFPPGHPLGLHEQSRLDAVHHIGAKYNLPALKNLGEQENHDAFKYAPVHSLESSVWVILTNAGLVSGEFNPTNPLLQEIVALKEEQHEALMRKAAIEVPGAAAFVRSLAAHGFKDKLAIASTAYRRDIFIALELMGLEEFFPPERVISKDMFTHAKPNPEAFSLAFESLHLDIPRGQVMAFEDDPRGVASAKAAGLYTFAIATRYGKMELEQLDAAPDVCAESYAQFRTLLALPT